MAKGDVAVSLTLPPDIDKTITRLARKQSDKAGKTISRREIIIQAVNLLAESAKAVK